MKIKLLSFFLLTFLMALFVACSTLPEQCVLIGTVSGNTNDTIRLATMHTDPRFVTQSFPVVEGQFEYTIYPENLEAYEMTFQSEYSRGSWRSIYFFPDKDTIRFELHSKDMYEKNIVVGGRQNEELYKYYNTKFTKYGKGNPDYMKYYSIYDSLKRNNELFTSDFYRLMDSVDAISDYEERSKQWVRLQEMIDNHDAWSEEAKLANQQMKMFQDEGKKWSDNYLMENAGLVSYALLMREVLLGIEPDRFQFVQTAFNQLAQVNPKHIYTKIGGDILGGIERIKVGGQFVDFTLPDPDGNVYTLSELIKGKVAIIDLWATYCGPCIRTTRTYKPIYEDFKDKGFTIVGVAAEIGDTKAMTERIKDEGWEWINLVDLDRKNNIWHKYNISFAGGTTLMVDQTGTIVALHPTAEEVRDLIGELL